jgi:1-pyrroline-5-carboxylate dehydrogenase
MISSNREPLTDFSIAENRAAYKKALQKINSGLGRDYPLIIGGERISTEKKIISYNPAKKNRSCRYGFQSDNRPCPAGDGSRRRKV